MRLLGRLATLLALALACTPCRALPILRAPRPPGAAGARAAAYLGASEASIFDASATGDGFARVSRLAHELTGEGFHREVRSAVRLELLAPAPSAARCEVALAFHLPANLFADLFELERLIPRRAGPGASVLVFEDAFLIGERTAPECNASALAIILPAAPLHAANDPPPEDTTSPETTTSEESEASSSEDASPSTTQLSTKTQLSASVSFPMHARYPAPDPTANLFSASATRLVDVALEPPSVFARCFAVDARDGRYSREEEEGEGAERKRWWRAEVPSGAADAAATWAVPAGPGGAAAITRRVTLAARWLAAGIVLAALRRTSAGGFVRFRVRGAEGGKRRRPARRRRVLGGRASFVARSSRARPWRRRP